jgi:hypothetical protein
MFFHATQEMAAKKAWYEALYPQSSAGALHGDGSTYYSMCSLYPGTAARIYKFNRDARIIYMMRHPVRRIESAWHQLLSVNHVNRARGFSHAVRHTNLFVDPSMYWRQLSEYRRWFSDDRILLVFFEEFIADEIAVTDACFAFLGVDAAAVSVRPANMDRNASEGKMQRALLIDCARLLPGYDRFKGVVPARVKSYGSTHFSAPVDPRVRWRLATLAWVVEQIAPDARALLEHAGRNPTYWTLP